MRAGASNTPELIDLAWLVLSIHALALVQALELQGGTSPRTGFSSSSMGIAACVRARVAQLTADRPLSDDIQALAGNLQTIDWTSTKPR